MYTRNELMFPHHAIPSLSQVRGEAWRELVNSLAGAPEDDPRALALMLLMVRLNGCMTCETDSFRAMRGCRACALQTLRRFKGSDEELLAQYQQALEEIQSYFAASNGAAG
ncbi:MAG: hypothetical protein RML95_15715 [Anaerolineae bacterium]|nr:hypothetical protein [Anaerolineae bacterium]MDW8300780.1 hypothetical protein [Anaerolineae bacterium]